MVKAADPTPQRAELLRVRLVDRLRSAGGSMQRNDLRQAIQADLTADQFDRIVKPLIDRGAVACEKVRCRYQIFNSKRSFERECTVYRLVTSSSKKPKRS